MASFHSLLFILFVITALVATVAFQPIINNPSLIRPSNNRLKLHPSQLDGGDIEPITVSTIHNNNDKLSLRYASCLAAVSIITIPTMAQAVVEGVGDKIGEISGGSEWLTGPSSAPIDFLSWLNGISNLLLHSTFFWIYVAISIYRIVKKEYIDKDS